MGGLTQEFSKWSNRRSAYSPRTGYASSRCRMSIVLTQKLIWDVANLEFLWPSLAPCLGHDGLYEAVSSPVASYENGKMGRWYLAAGPFFFSVVLGLADLPRDPLLTKQPTLDCCWSEEHEPRVVLECSPDSEGWVPRWLRSLLPLFSSAKSRLLDGPIKMFVRHR